MQTASSVALYPPFIEDGAEVTIEVLAECVYVLRGVYAQSREDVAEVLADLLDEVECERGFVAWEALRIFGRANLDFEDCVLAAETAVNGRVVLTFDRKLSNLIESL